MGNRRRAREMALQGLYTADLLGLWDRDPEELLPAKSESPESLPFARKLLGGVFQYRSDIDREIEASAIHWSLHRMNVVDRNILRVAAFELLYCEDIPVRVSINEALELAKVYGEKETAAFLNGILDKVARTRRRPAGV